jgi:protein-disulfide isomerase
MNEKSLNQTAKFSRLPALVASSALVAMSLLLVACQDEQKAEAPASTEQAAKPAETAAATPAATDAKPAETAAATPADIEIPEAKGSVDVAKLMEAGPLNEMAIGPADAKVTIVEYASMTCGHCAAFHNSTFKEVKTKYVDSGKVRFVFREYPFDALAEAGFMLARCNEAQYLPMVSALFSAQSNWVRAEKPSEALFQISRQAGFTQDSFNACLQNNELLQNIRAVRTKGEEFGVEATPTFFINGEKFSGNMSIEQMSALIDARL